MTAIDIKNLTKTYGDLKAIDNISIEVNQGEIFGLLGPNGAGKTTLIKMLATLLKPTSGEAKVWGFDILKEQNQVRKSIGIVFQEPALDNNLTGKENLDFHARLYGLVKKERKSRMQEVLELVGLNDKADVLVKHYSGGMQRRLEIARGLMHFPKILFLDEPTLGLDPQTRRHIWEYIKKLNQTEKTTIILTTHYMEEADFLCDRIAIIDFGKIVALNTPDKLKNVLGGDVISMEVTQPEKALEKFKTFKWIKQINKHDNFIDINVEEGEKKIPILLKEFSNNTDIEIKTINLRKPSLEDVFLHFTGKTIREAEVSTAENNKKQMRKRITGR